MGCLHWARPSQTPRPGSKQECIPVGCVPSAAVAVPGRCLPTRGVSACQEGGVCLLCILNMDRGAKMKLRIKWNFELTVFELSVPDLYMWGVYTERDRSRHQDQEVNKKDAVRGLVFLPDPPLPWTEWQTRVKTLPCRNYVADGIDLYGTLAVVTLPRPTDNRISWNRYRSLSRSRPMWMNHYLLVSSLQSPHFRRERRIQQCHS